MTDFVNIYGELELDTGILSYFYDFSSYSTISGIPFPRINDGSFHGSKYGTPLSASGNAISSGYSFTGNGVFSIKKSSPHDIPGSRDKTLIIDLERVGTPASIVYQEVWPSGPRYTFGFTDNQKPFLHHENGEGKQEHFVFHSVNLPRRSIVSFSKTFFTANVSYCDPDSFETYSENVSFNSLDKFVPGTIPSEYIGGTISNSYSDRYGYSGFSGNIYQMAGFNTSLGEGQVRELLSGFRQVSGTPTYERVFSGSGVSDDFLNLTGDLGSDSGHFNLLTDAVSNAFLSGANSGIYTGYVSGGADAYSPHFYHYDIRSPSHTISGTGQGTSFSFSAYENASVWASYGGGNYANYTYNFLITQTAVQPDDYRLYRSVSENWESGKLTDYSFSGSTGIYLFDGLSVITTGGLYSDLYCQTNLDSGSNIVSPSGYHLKANLDNISGKYWQNKASYISAYEAKSGIGTGNIVNSGGFIDPSGLSYSGNESLIYDVGSGVTDIFSGQSWFSSGVQRYPRDFTLHLSRAGYDVRLELGKDYFQTSSGDMLHGTGVNGDYVSGASPIYLNTELFWS